MCIDYKPPFIRWFENDFWADRDVILLTWLQRHLYRALLLSAFYCDTRPFLPADDSQLWKFADAGSLETWTENRSAILAKFTAFEDEDGKKLLRNKRLDEEWAHLLRSLQKQRNAGLASAANRASRGLTSVDGGSTSVDGSSTEVNPSEYRVQSTEPENRVQSTEPEKPSPSRKRDGGLSASPLFGPSKEYAFEGWKAKFGQAPTWSAKDFTGLARLLKSKPTLTLDEFKARWTHYLADADPFVGKQGHSLAFFCSRFDSYITSPAPAGKKGPNGNAQRSAPGKYDGLGKVCPNS